MEAETRAAEEAEKKRVEMEKKIQEDFSFGDAKSQWEKDKEAASSIAKDKVRQGSDSDSAEQPQKSLKSVKPAKPAQPAQPAEPAKVAEPAKAAQAAGPAKAAEPARKIQRSSHGHLEP